VMKRFTHSGQRVDDLKDVKPVVRTIYDWVSFKAKPIQLKDFEAFAKTVKVDPTLNLEREWRLYADNLIAAMVRGRLHLNYCLDYQLLIRICYLLRDCLKLGATVYGLNADVTAELIDRLLTLPIVLPKGVVNSRCREHCSQPRSP